MATKNKSTLKDEEEFLENYDKHDISEAYLRDRLEWYGYEVESCGIDNRNEGVQFSSWPDLRILKDGETVGYVDAKAKASQYSSWKNKVNKRAFEDYLYGGEVTEDDPDPFPGQKAIDVPVWVFITVVDEDSRTIVTEHVTEIRSEEQIDREFTAQHDGNQVIVFRNSELQSWSELVSSLISSDKGE